MSMQELLHRNRDKAARVAGLLYLIVVVAGMFSLAYVPSQLGLSGDAQLKPVKQAIEYVRRVQLSAR